jgi:hypothetical protein
MTALASVVPFARAGCGLRFSLSVGPLVARNAGERSRFHPASLTKRVLCWWRMSRSSTEPQDRQDDRYRNVAPLACQIDAAELPPWIVAVALNHQARPGNAATADHSEPQAHGAQVVQFGFTVSSRPRPSASCRGSARSSCVASNRVAQSLICS